MSKTNRECYTCGQKYYYCPTCPSGEKKEVFYNMFHCERCSKIFKLLTDETFKHITIAQCKEELLKLDINQEEVFKPSVKEHIKKILNYELPVEQEEAKVDIVEEEQVVVIEEEIKVAEETVDTEETVTKRITYVPKKNRKKIVK